MQKISSFLHHLFVPQEANNFRARVLHHDFLSLYLVLAVVFVFSLKGLSQFKNVLGYATDISTQKLLELTNKERSKYALGELSYNEKLAVAASQKAQDMFAQNYWAHYAPNGRTPWSFMYDAGYQYEYAGENLAKNFLFSKNVVDAWMNSESHKENLLRPQYTEVGLAVVNGVLNGEPTTLVVQMFGKPMEGASPQINLAGVQSEKSKIVSPRLSLNLFWFFILFLSLALILDLYFAVRFSIIRFHIKNIPHIIFIVFFCLGILFFITKGAIL